MPSGEIMIQAVLYHLVGDKREQTRGLETFLQGSTGVERDLKMLLQLEKTRHRVSLDAMVKFVEALPQLEWIILACDVMLQEPTRWDTLVVACMLHRAMAFATDKTLVLAEMCWIQRLDYATRAIASNSPISIISLLGNNHLYAAGDRYVCNRVNRSVFCWKGQWMADGKKELWRIVPVSTGSRNFYVVSVYTDEFLRSSKDCVESIEGISMKPVFVRREDQLPNDSAIWRLIKSEGATYTFYNVCQAAFLTSPAKAPDGSRRGVVTTPFRPFDEKMSACREWKIVATAPTRMEQGLTEFFSRKYNEAVKTFTSVLATEGLSAVDCTKMTCYRMAANLMLENEGCFREDFDLLNGQDGQDGVPDYFFGALANQLTDQEKKILEQRPELNVERLAEDA